MSECKCDFRTYMVGDGCEACNPAKALEYALETIADQAAELDTLGAKLAAAEARAERYRHLLADIKQWDISQFMSIPHLLRERMQSALAEGEGE